MIDTATASVTIDGTPTQAGSDETILEVATRLGIPIPTLCHLKGKTRLESCGICMVEVAGQSSFLPACASKVTPGMVIRTDSEDLREVRKTALELLLSDHQGDCLAPCERACPADIEIPDFIREIKRGHPDEALRIITRKIAFPGVLGRVCPRFCERVCRRGEIDDPIAICSLKRFPADQEGVGEAPVLPTVQAKTGKKVAIVGAGIVGMTAAYYLLLEGHDCTIFESRHRAGGALDSVLPEFRLPRDVLQTEVERIVRMGADFRFGQALGTHFELEQLQKDYDAVLLAVGASKEKLPDFPGVEYAESGLGLLNRVAQGEGPSLDGKALVIGSGPTAMDTCRTLLRLGAEQVSLLMSPGIGASLFFKAWIEDGLAEGVQVLDEADREQIGHLPDGRYRCHFHRGGEEQTLEVSHIYLAGHVEPDLDCLKSLGLAITHQGVRVDRRTLATSLEGVFAAGNIAQAGRYSVQGSAAGRHAARSISAYLVGAHWEEHLPIDVRMHNLSPEETAVLFSEFAGGRRGIPDRSTGNGKATSWNEVDHGFTTDQANIEAARCLSCDCAAKSDCLLRSWSTNLQANPKAFGGAKPRFERDLSHPEVVYESGKCIRCGHCIAVCEEYRDELGLTFIGRGFEVKVGVPFGKNLEEGLHEAAIRCAEVCPTGALAKRR